MKYTYTYIIFILTYSVLMNFTGPALSQPDSEYYSGGYYEVDSSLRKATDIADSKQNKAQRRAETLNELFKNGRQHYRAKRYKRAIGYFEEILEIDPMYEPAKLYIESSVIHLEIETEQGAINDIKLKMADVMTEYDRRRQGMHSLAIKYFLEKAQMKCQVGDYEGAEELYRICYKIYPYSTGRMEWFVEATYELIRLSRVLKKHHKKIDELIVFDK